MSVVGECAKIEVDSNSADDMLSVPGFLRALRLVLRLKVGGLLWAGTPCSSWTFLNRGTSGRSSERPLGNEQVPSVRLANEIVSKVVLLLIMAACRHAAWTTEQPISSLMDRHPRMLQLRRLCFCRCQTCALRAVLTWSRNADLLADCNDGSFCVPGCVVACAVRRRRHFGTVGPSTYLDGKFRPLVAQADQAVRRLASFLLATKHGTCWQQEMPFSCDFSICALVDRSCLLDLKRTLTKKERAKKGLHSVGVTRTSVNHTGKRSVSGGPRLKATQTYTYEFGRAVALLKKNYVLTTHLKPPARRTFWCLHGLPCLWVFTFVF